MYAWKGKHPDDYVVIIEKSFVNFITHVSMPIYRYSRGEEG
jgi:hypothetical protein